MLATRPRRKPIIYASIYAPGPAVSRLRRLAGAVWRRLKAQQAFTRLGMQADGRDEVDLPLELQAASTLAAPNRPAPHKSVVAARDEKMRFGASCSDAGVALARPAIRLVSKQHQARDAPYMRSHHITRHRPKPHPCDHPFTKPRGFTRASSRAKAAEVPQAQGAIDRCAGEQPVACCDTKHVAVDLEVTEPVEVELQDVSKQATSKPMGLAAGCQASKASCCKTSRRRWLPKGSSNLAQHVEKRQGCRQARAKREGEGGARQGAASLESYHCALEVRRSPSDADRQGRPHTLM